MKHIAAVVNVMVRTCIVTPPKKPVLLEHVVIVWAATPGLTPTQSRPEKRSVLFVKHPKNK